MEKYTALEQAVRDPSLAIITEDIATLKELNKIYVKYKVLPKRLKRFSNYYSNEFTGHGVPEMYVLLKDRLENDSTVFEEWKQQNEKYLLSEPDLYYKEDSFNAGDTNICFILGHSGSGKSMMARTLEGDDIDHIELDDLLLTKDHFTMDELRDYSDMFFSFFTGEGAKYYIGVEESSGTIPTCSSVSLPAREQNTTSVLRRETAFPRKNTKTKYLQTSSDLRWSMQSITGKRNTS